MDLFHLPVLFSHCVFLLEIESRLVRVNISNFKREFSLDSWETVYRPFPHSAPVAGHT